MAASLSTSVSSLQSSLQLLDSSINILDQGVNDFPRLCKVLQTTRVRTQRAQSLRAILLTNYNLKHFELLPEPTLHAAQQSLLDEITPSITHLLTLASNHIDRLSRREESLRAKAELQEGRLSHRRSSTTAGSTSRQRSLSRGARKSEAGAGNEALEFKRLEQKKARLKYAVDRLELQSKQRERELRKSMAAQ